jgi:N-acetylneuraminic acid mutarotase
MPKSLKITSWFAAIAVLLTLNWASVAYAQGTWTPLAPVSPAAAEGMAVGGVGQVIIAAYGFSGGDTNLTRRYNITTNSWSLGTNAPGSPSSEQAYGETTHGGFLYVIGGRANGAGAAPLSDLRRYDPDADTWLTLASMNTPRAGAAAAIQDDAIFVIGGRAATGGPCTGSPLSVVERYDIMTDTWSTVAPLPGPARSDLAAVSHGGKIFVFGGCSDVGVVTGEVDKYDPQTDTWTTGLAPMLPPRASFVAGKVGDTVFAIGGSLTGTDQVSVNQSYKISSDSWSTTPAAMPTSRSEAGVHSHGGRVYVVGGGNRGISTDANEVFKPKP